MYINRLFFRADIGTLIYRHSMEGDIVIPTIEQDLEILAPLKDYNKEMVVVVEVPKEEEANTIIAKNIRLDLETGELIFDFTPEQLEEKEKYLLQEERIVQIEQLVADLASLQLGV